MDGMKIDLPSSRKRAGTGEGPHACVLGVLIELGGAITEWKQGTNGGGESM